MPLPPSQDIHASEPLRRLRDRQSRALVAYLQREPGRRALRIGVAADDPLPTARGIDWALLWLAGHRYAGAVQASTDEPLPFLDEAFDMVWLQHALEPAGQASALLEEACRVLGDGGLLVVTGIHPLSAWAPWYRWQARGQRQTLHSPWWWRRMLVADGMTIEQQYRLGPAWPTGAAREGADSRCGGGCLLLARKRHPAAVPLAWQPRPVRVPVNAQLSPGTRRHAAVRTEITCDD